MYILWATKGQAGQNDTAEKKRLSSIRSKELLQSAKVLGVKKVFFLGFKDGMLCNNLYHKLAAKIQEKLEELKPETILTFEPRGVSGHIDHIAVSMVSAFVFYKLPFVKTMLQYCTKAEYTKHMKHYYIYFPPGYKRSEIDKIVDISDVWETKVKAMQQHKSQQKDVEFILNIQQHLPKEDYFLLVKK